MWMTCSHDSTCVRCRPARGEWVLSDASGSGWGLKTAASPDPSPPPGTTGRRPLWFDRPTTNGPNPPSTPNSYRVGSSTGSGRTELRVSYGGPDRLTIWAVLCGLRAWTCGRRRVRRDVVLRPSVRLCRVGRDAIRRAQGRAVRRWMASAEACTRRPRRLPGP